MSLLLRPALRLAALGAVGALAVGGCSSGSGSDTSGAAPSPGTSSTGSGSVAGSPQPVAPSPEPSSTVSVPSGVQLTDQGSALRFGASANVIFESTKSRGTVLRLTVMGVQRAGPDDFKGFILDDKYKRQANYYYAKVRVSNVGEGDVGGVPVPLWGVSGDNVLLPPVNFTATFPPCPTRPLPKTFGPGSSLSTCLVFLSPDNGSLEAVSYRPSQDFNPITWTGQITKPAPRKTPTPRHYKKTPIR